MTAKYSPRKRQNNFNVEIPLIGWQQLKFDPGNTPLRVLLSPNFLGQSLTFYSLHSFSVQTYTLIRMSD